MCTLIEQSDIGINKTVRCLQTTVCLVFGCLWSPCTVSAMTLISVVSGVCSVFGVHNVLVSSMSLVYIVHERSTLC